MGKYFGTDGFRGEAGVHSDRRPRLQGGPFSGLVLQRSAGAQRQQRACPYRHWQGYPPQLVHVRVQPGGGPDRLRRGCLPAARHHHAQSVAYIARVDDFDCGIMISASHNPVLRQRHQADRLLRREDAGGDPAAGRRITSTVSSMCSIRTGRSSFAHREHIGCTVDYVAGRNRYMGYLISLGIYSFKGVKVGLDCANGSPAGTSPRAVFDALGARHLRHQRTSPTA